MVTIKEGIDNGINENALSLSSEKAGKAIDRCSAHLTTKSAAILLVVKVLEER